MNLAELMDKRRDPFFSCELTPPERGASMRDVTEVVDMLAPMRPLFIDITNHAADSWFEERPDGSFVRHITRKRPGTLGLCAALKYRYEIETVPHLLCHGFTREETEDALIELSFLGIRNVLAIRGDQPDWKEDRPGARNKYAVDVVRQIMDMNAGKYLHRMSDVGATDFCVGVAGYPEKHFEAPSLAFDIQRLKEKVDAGASYVVTQMFFDNRVFFRFVKLCREAGIEVPIIPGLKVLSRKGLLSSIPRHFHVDIPDDLVAEVTASPDRRATAEIGVRHAVEQARDLIENGAPGVHFYVYSEAPLAADVVRKLGI